MKSSTAPWGQGGEDCRVIPRRRPGSEDMPNRPPRNHPDIPLWIAPPAKPASRGAYGCRGNVPVIPGFTQAPNPAAIYGAGGIKIGRAHVELMSLMRIAYA